MTAANLNLYTPGDFGLNSVINSRLLFLDCVFGHCRN